MTRLWALHLPRVPFSEEMEGINAQNRVCTMGLFENFPHIGMALSAEMLDSIAFTASQVRLPWTMLKR